MYLFFGLGNTRTGNLRFPVRLGEDLPVPRLDTLVVITLSKAVILVLAECIDWVPVDDAQGQSHIRVGKVVRLFGPALLPGGGRLLAE